MTETVVLKDDLSNLHAVIESLPPEKQEKVRGVLNTLRADVAALYGRTWEQISARWAKDAADAAEIEKEKRKQTRERNQAKRAHFADVLRRQAALVASIESALHALHESNQELRAKMVNDHYPVIRILDPILRAAPRALEGHQTDLVAWTEKEIAARIANADEYLHVEKE
jgi:hypothetical protein